MLSMTGFGSGEAQIGNLSLTVELRSVNHRFLDVGLKLPGALTPYEGGIRKFLKDNLARGRVTVSAQLTQGHTDRDAAVDPDRLSQAVAMVRSAAAALEKETGEKQPVTLDHLLSVPDLFRAEEAEFDPEELEKGLMEALAGALVGLNAMKKAEGAALVDEMRGRLDVLAAKLAEVTKLAPRAAVEVQARLEERLGKLMTDGLDPQRLAQEVALLADKANINEECERLGIHITSYREALEGGGQVAKKLNFLLQEMHREVNTMGSKTNLMDITQAVIVMKEEVESLREQVQNLE